MSPDDMWVVPGRVPVEPTLSLLNPTKFPTLVRLENFIEHRIPLTLEIRL